MNTISELFKYKLAIIIAWMFLFGVSLLGEAELLTSIVVSGIISILTTVIIIKVVK